MIALKVPFTVEAGAVATTSQYPRIVRSQVIDAVTTNQGERLMNPTYGCNILANLFDPSDQLVQSDVAGQVAAKLPNFCPRCLVTGVTLTPEHNEENIVIINIRYTESQFSPETAVAIPLDTSGSTP